MLQAQGKRQEEGDPRCRKGSAAAGNSAISALGQRPGRSRRTELQTIRHTRANMIA